MTSSDPRSHRRAPAHLRGAATRSLGQVPRIPRSTAPVPRGRRARGPPARRARPPTDNGRTPFLSGLPPSCASPARWTPAAPLQTLPNPLRQNDPPARQPPAFPCAPLFRRPAAANAAPPGPCPTPRAVSAGPLAPWNPDCGHCGRRRGGNEASEPAAPAASPPAPAPRGQSGPLGGSKHNGVTGRPVNCGRAGGIVIAAVGAGCGVGGPRGQQHIRGGRGAGAQGRGAHTKAQAACMASTLSVALKRSRGQPPRRPARGGPGAVAAWRRGRGHRRGCGPHQPAGLGGGPRSRRAARFSRRGGSRRRRSRRPTGARGRSDRLGGGGGRSGRGGRGGGVRRVRRAREGARPPLANACRARRPRPRQRAEANALCPHRISCDISPARAPRGAPPGQGGWARGGGRGRGGSGLGSAGRVRRAARAPVLGARSFCAAAPWLLAAFELPSAPPCPPMSPHLVLPQLGGGHVHVPLAAGLLLLLPFLLLLLHGRAVVAAVAVAGLLLL
jgi:hypothetical protein